MEKDIEYFVNRERGVVVCRINKCEEIVDRRMNKYTSSLWCGFSWEKTKIPNSFIGIAKCAPEDEFDEEFGKKLALLRAKQARAAAINGKLYELIRRVRHEADVLEKYGIHPIPTFDEEN